MGSRRKARELGLQVLYQIEMKGSEPKKELRLLEGQSEIIPEVLQFAEELVEGTFRNLKEIDGVIERHSAHWKLQRMSAVDRNILRLAVYEILFLREIPSTVTINEAIDIAKKFGTEHSGSFINGVLDTLSREVRP